MEARTRRTFLALIVAQAAHSVEEWVFALYDVFAPARFVSGLVSSNLATGFAILNAGIVALGVWCYAARVRPAHPSARTWMWAWVALEVANGISHSAMSAMRASYFPGVATAPFLLVFAIYLAMLLLREARTPDPPLG